MIRFRVDLNLSLDEATIQLIILICAFIFANAGAANAGPCDEMLRLAQQTAAEYRANHDPYQLEASQNYRSGYDACIRTQPSVNGSPGLARPPSMLFSAPPSGTNGLPNSYSSAVIKNKAVENSANMDEPESDTAGGQNSSASNTQILQSPIVSQGNGCATIASIADDFDDNIRFFGHPSQLLKVQVALAINCTHPVRLYICGIAQYNNPQLHINTIGPTWTFSNPEQFIFNIYNQVKPSYHISSLVCALDQASCRLGC